ncbi:MAG: hypothetical protein HY295_07600 [Thaumarchaeota archaeon]|nr:hypothetical protein [Nitrososphaerota archaeon]
MKDPHNYRAVGWSMVVVSASLAIIGLIVISPLNNPHFSETILKGKQAKFMEMKEKMSQLNNKSLAAAEKTTSAVTNTTKEPAIVEKPKT